MKLSFLLFLFIFREIIFCQEISDLIQPVNLTPGKTTTILISDIFYSEKYPVKFLQENNLDVRYDSISMELSITPKTGFSGLDLLSFTFGDKTFAIPVKLKKSKSYIFRYKAAPGDKVINLFGQFNGWERYSLNMKDPDKDGIYETEIPLEPGRYEYKFFVDGKELIDPENPVEVPNGLGGFNSVKIIEETGNKIFLHITGMEEQDENVNLRFYFESSNDNSISSEDVIALFDNRELLPGQVGVNGNSISFQINREMLSGTHVIRAAVNKNGMHTNIQSVQLHDGKPAGTSGKRTIHDNIIYSIMVDRFCDGDSSNSVPVEHDSLFKPANYQGGDLQGIINKIEEGYFEKLGVNTLWISPIIDNTNYAYREYPEPRRYYTGYHGYWPVSSTKVEEKFGSIELARNLVDKSHETGINVLWDYVAHHVHKEHWLWKEHPEWFGTLELPDGRLNLRLWEEHRLTTWFEPYMPSFNFADSYDALEFMTDNAVWWLKVTGADGFRHDAVKHVPNEFWRMLTRKIKKNFTGKNIYQIGETFGSLELINSYVNNGQLNAQFNFNLYDAALPVFLDENSSFKLLDFQLQKSFQVFGYNNVMGNIIDSHDKIRYMAYADGDLVINDGSAAEAAWNNPPEVNDPESYKKLELHIAYLLTIPGIPVIYYGDEIGMTGAADPDNRRMMKFGDELNEYEKQTLNDISRLVRIRRNHPALRYGDFFTLKADENIYAYLRSDLSERILVILNKGSKEENVRLDLPSFYNLISAADLLEAETFKIKKNSVSFIIPPFGWKVLKLD